MKVFTQPLYNDRCISDPYKKTFFARINTVNQNGSLDSLVIKKMSWLMIELLRREENMFSSVDVLKIVANISGL